MLKKDLEQIIKNYLIEGKIKELLEMLSAYVKGRDNYLENDLILQQSAFNATRRDFSNGILSREDYDRAIARIKNAITQILERCPARGNFVESPFSTENEPTKTSLAIILFLTANPLNTRMLALEKELRQVKDELAMTTSRDKFKLVSEPAVKVPTITKAMQVYRPTVVHFSGHGTGKEGIVVETDKDEYSLFPTEGLKRMFKLFQKDVKCILLNACYSEVQAKVISELGIYVIGMNKAIGDSAAIAFAVGFYQSLGEGNDYEFAYQIAMINIAPHLKDANTPVLWFNGKQI